MSFDITQDSIASSTSSQDWDWWGQPPERYMTEQEERNIRSSTPKDISLDFMPLNIGEQATAQSHSSRVIENLRIDLSQSLVDLSQILEGVLNRMGTAWPELDIQCYPIGDVFHAFKKLPIILRQDEPANTLQSNPRMSRNDPHKCLKTKDALLASHCYVLCVKILAPISEKLYQHLSSLAKSALANPQRGLDEQRHRRSPLEMFENGDEGLNVTLRPGLRLGELYSQFDPFGHALNCACATISAGIRLLRDTETILGIPVEQGVLAEDSASPTRTQQSESVMLFPARLVAVIWDEEEMDPKHGQTKVTALALLQRYRMAISRLARQRHLLLPHPPALYSHVNSDCL
ncbi:hypothetical protein L207DRAFT_582281 [Hyaloscypha variabilis F]|uniref:Uncharacterized protein n=1 Tax=Hyaloscypha variabilis (strain UAMH 11265 / GT02V1 / F) TaxID=1149755 RepID=A0A2J6RTL2_HYAVF|nr:hypothetical protein L207DRAFT_582281 [Hyaloscypha variabilis F]